MTGCVEIYTDVNYHSEYGQSQENQRTGKFVLHIFAYSFIWLPIGKPEFPAPSGRCRRSGVGRRSNPRENYLFCGFQIDNQLELSWLLDGRRNRSGYGSSGKASVEGSA
jgi:hypothetical protein